MGSKVVQMNENSWRIEDDGVRCFLLTGTQKALLIDTGMHLTDVRTIVQGITDLPVCLLNTHADMDHTGCNEQFEEFYMHPAEEPNYRSSGKSGKILPLAEGDTIDLGGRELKVMVLPGHTPGSVALLDADARVLISGDTIQQHGDIFMFGENRNMDDYVKSLKRLIECSAQFDEIWPSHADIPLSPDAIVKLYDGVQDMIAGKISGKKGEMFGFPMVEYDLGCCKILWDR